MAWAGYTNEFDSQAMAVAWGLDWEYGAGDHALVWTWEPTGIETRSRIVSMDPIVMGLDGKTVDIRVTIENTTSIDSTQFSAWNLNPNNPPMIGKEAKILAYGEDLATDDFYIGTVKEVERVDERHVVVTLSDRTDERLSQLIGDVLESSDYSYMPKDSIGRMKPIVFGELTEFVPILVTEPPRTRLGADVMPFDGELTVEDTTNFPSSGTVVIEEEEFTYTGKTSTTFTGVAGGGGTGRTQHPTGAYVYLKDTCRWYVSEHTSSVSAIYGYDETSDTLVDLTSSATVVAGPPTTITFASQPKIVRKQANPLALDHSTTGYCSTWTVDYNTIANKEYMSDQNLATEATFTNPDPFTNRAQVHGTFSNFSGLAAIGTLSHMIVQIAYGDATDTVGVEVSVIFDPGGGKEETVTQTLGASTSYGVFHLIFRPTGTFTTAEFTANTPQIRIRTGADTAAGILHVTEVQGYAAVVTDWEFIEYVEHPVRILALSCTGLRNANGNAGNIITDILTATSFASAGLTSGDLNTTSLSGLGTYFTSYKFSGAITERETARDVVGHVLRQMGGGYYWDRARDFKVYWDGSTPGAVTLTSDDILSGSLIWYKVPQLGNAVNYVVCHYDYSWLRGTYRANVTYESTFYSGIYGQRRADLYADWIRTSALGTNYATRVVNSHAQPPPAIEFQTPLARCTLEQYDTVNINDFAAGKWWSPAGANLLNLRILEIAIDPMRDVCKFKVGSGREYL